MSNSGVAGGGSNFTQGTNAAKPAPTPNALYFATDTGEWWIANAAGNAWQEIARVAQALSLGPTNSIGTLTFGPGGVSITGDGSGKISTNAFGWDLTHLTTGLLVAEGANAKQGVATLVAGTVTVANTSVTANSRILHSAQEGGVLTGIVKVSARVVGTSFTLTSTVGTDTAVIAWEIFEPG